jgi:hypothetical protein
MIALDKSAGEIPVPPASKDPLIEALRKAG